MITKDDLKKLNKAELIAILGEAIEKDANFNLFVYNRVNNKSISSKKINSFQKKLIRQSIDFHTADKMFKEYSLLIDDSYTYSELIKDYLEYLLQMREENIHDILEDLDDIIVDVFQLACNECGRNNKLITKEYLASRISSLDYVFEYLLSELSNIFSGYFNEYYDEIE